MEDPLYYFPPGEINGFLGDKNATGLYAGNWMFVVEDRARDLFRSFVHYTLLVAKLVGTILIVTVIVGVIVFTVVLDQF